MASCVGCSSFNPYYHGGYCNDYEHDTSPNGWCPHCDDRGSHPEFDAEKVCKNCDTYRNYRCTYHKCSTNPESYCSDFRYA